LKYTIYVIVAIVAGIVVGTVGPAYGGHISDHFLGKVEVDGQLTANTGITSNGNIVTKSDGSFTIFNVLSNTGKANNFKFVHFDAPAQEFQLRQVTAGDKFELFDKTNSKVMLSANSNGRLGLLTTSPTQTVDINGDVRFRQDLHLDSGVNILSSGDICIGTCP